MKTVLKPKSLPWLARRAGMSDPAIDALWNKALAVAGIDPGQAAEPRRQAAAMQTLLLMLGSGRQAAGASPSVQAALCQ